MSKQPKVEALWGICDDCGVKKQNGEANVNEEVRGEYLQVRGRKHGRRERRHS